VTVHRDGLLSETTVDAASGRARSQGHEATHPFWNSFQEDLRPCGGFAGSASGSRAVRFENVPIFARHCSEFLKCLICPGAIENRRLMRPCWARLLGTSAMLQSLLNEQVGTHIAHGRCVRNGRRWVVVVFQREKNCGVLLLTCKMYRPGM
jgi:hypothetical protein